jgi:hypothetical protein
MLKVWLICVATKSSKRVFAPGATDAGVFAGLDCRHWTALIYAFLSDAQSLFLYIR